MTSLRKITLAIPALLFSVMSFAQQDPKAKLILDEVSKTAKAYSTISATFSITVKQKDGSTDVKNGSVLMKSGKYKITLDNKVKDVIKKEEYYNDGKTTWVYIEKNKEVTIDNAPDPAKKKAENSISVNDIFTIHEKGFNYTFIKEETQNGRVVQIIDLIPEKPDKKNYFKIKVTIDKVKKQIINIVQMNKDGSSITYNVKTFTPNTEVPDTTFQFDKKLHPGVTVIDLRDEEDGK
jgi:outer membrane lipoprotein-sorting protein